MRPLEIDQAVQSSDTEVEFNQVERWFAELTRQQLQRGVHRSALQLEADIRTFIETHNDEDPKPFRWTKSADDILAAVKRFCLRDEQKAQVPHCRAEARAPRLTDCGF